MNLPVDHLIYAAPTLESGMDKIEALLGVRPIYGGQHPGFGTHNALLALGPDSYLEVIATDPAQSDVPRPLWIPVDRLTQPRLIRWVAKSNDLSKLVQMAQRNGLELGQVLEGSRTKPGGELLRWRLTDPRVDPAGGIIPFFIDWGETPHPARALPQGGVLLSLSAGHPAAGKVQAQLLGIGLDLSIKAEQTASLVAIIQTPAGIVELQ